jgi:uncharacterized protein YciI
MRQFIVRLSEKQPELMTNTLIQDHVDYLRQLKSNSVLSFCGPCKDGTAIMILSCGSRDEAQKFVDDDPFSEVGYYNECRIVEVEEATEENGFLLPEKFNHRDE